MGDVRKLREAVEIANEAAAKLEARKLYPDHAPNIGRAYNGSLDAAKALHEALLPGWDWTMHGNGQAAIWPPGSVDEQNSGCIEADVEGLPSRALLLAILRALEGGESGNPQ